MQQSVENSREAHEYRHGYKILAKGQGGVESVREQKESDSDWGFTMTDSVGLRFAALEEKVAISAEKINQIKQAQDDHAKLSLERHTTIIEELKRYHDKEMQIIGAAGAVKFIYKLIIPSVIAIFATLILNIKTAAAFILKTIP